MSCSTSPLFPLSGFPCSSNFISYQKDMPALVECSGQELLENQKIDSLLGFMNLSWYVPVRGFGSMIISFPRDCCCYFCLDRLFLRWRWGFWGTSYFPKIFSVAVFLDLMSCILKKITGMSLMIRRRLWCQLPKTEHK